MADLRWIIIMGILWLTNFALLYFINVRNLSKNSYLTNYWTNEFFPLPLDLSWFTTYVSENIPLQFGIPYLPGLVVILILAGWFWLYVEARPVAWTFALITIFAFAASAMQLYPVKGRLTCAKNLCGKQSYSDNGHSRAGCVFAIWSAQYIDTIVHYAQIFRTHASLYRLSLRFLEGR